MSSYVVRHGKRIEIETLKTVASPPRRGMRGDKETFARIPHNKGMRLYGIDGAAWVVLLELDRLIFKAYGRNPVKLGNESLKDIGMPRNTKWKALRQLQKAGVITVVQQGQEATLVTHHWHPLKPYGGGQ
jgi:hypothetical protein